MNEEDFRKALEAADREMAQLLQQRRAMDERIGQLKATRDALAKLLEDAPADKWIKAALGAAGAVATEELAIEELGITDAIRRILVESHSPMSPPEIKDALVNAGLPLDNYANPLSVIHNTLKRLEKQGELLSVKDQSGKVFAYTTKWFGGGPPLPIDDR